MTRDGADEDEPKSPAAPHPASGQSQDGHDDRNQGRLRLGVRGEGGLPLRVGLRDGHCRERVDTPLALAACLAWGVAGVRGRVAASQA
jgi:hypothetical protein